MGGDEGGDEHGYSRFPKDANVTVIDGPSGPSIKGRKWKWPWVIGLYIRDYYKRP